jgi:hypothetical protein
MPTASAAPSVVSRSIITVQVYRISIDKASRLCKNCDEQRKPRLTPGQGQASMGNEKNHSTSSNVDIRGAVSEEVRNGNFRNLCVLYGDFNRDVFLEETLNFLRGADKHELNSMRKSIRARAKQLKKGQRRGRPRGQDDPNWRGQALKQVWQRDILGWTWPKIASAAGMKPTKPNIRTLERRREKVAEMIWAKLPVYTDLPDLKRLLSQADVQTLLRFEAGLPFKTHREQCQELVLKLAPLGLKVAAVSLTRSVH